VVLVTCSLPHPEKFAGKSGFLITIHTCTCNLHFVQELPTAFVSFKTRWEAVVTAQTQQSQNPMLWVTEWAPEPRDVDWGNLEIPYEHHFFRGIVAAIGAGLITIFYIPLTTLVLALANLDSLYKFLPHVLLEILLKMLVS
jgi:hypothetical protein